MELNKKILVIEDNDVSQRTVANFFRKMGCQINLSSTVEEGVSLANELIPDLIICDIILSGGSCGFDLCQKIRQNELTGHIPIIVLTGSEEIENKKKAFCSGAQVYIKKPFSPKKLLQATLLLLTLDKMDDEVGEDDELKQLQSQFISLVSHEFRTPMTSLKIAVGLLADKSLGDVNKEQEEFLALMDKNLKYMGHLVESITDVSEINKGNLILSKTVVDLKEIVESILKKRMPDIAEKDHKVKWEEMKKCSIYCDYKKIFRVIEFLLDNSIRHNPEGTEISIRVERRNSDSQVRFFVEDNGVGISNSDQKKIFSKFYRNIQSVKINSQGLGLGLAIAQGILEAHNSHLCIKSKIGQGSQFYFDLPVSMKEN